MSTTYRGCGRGAQLRWGCTLSPPKEVWFKSKGVHYKCSEVWWKCAPPTDQGCIIGFTCSVIRFLNIIMDTNYTATILFLNWLQAKRFAESIENAVWTNQFDNTANRQAHIETTGPEIWQGTAGRVDAVTFGTGTGGTLAGIKINIYTTCQRRV